MSLTIKQRYQIAKQLDAEGDATAAYALLRDADNPKLAEYQASLKKRATGISGGGDVKLWAVAIVALVAVALGAVGGYWFGDTSAEVDTVYEGVDVETAEAREAIALGVGAFLSDCDPAAFDVYSLGISNDLTDPAALRVRADGLDAMEPTGCSDMNQLRRDLAATINALANEQTDAALRDIIGVVSRLSGYTEARLDLMAYLESAQDRG